MNGQRFYIVRYSGQIVAAFATFLILCAAPSRAQTPLRLTQDPLAGSKVFGEKGCVKCHAVNGLGGTVGPDLGQISRRRSFYELAATMWNHLPKMEAAMEEHGIERPQIDAREAGDLIAFLFTLDYFDPPGDVNVGQQLFSEKKCVVCHQIGVYGGVVGPSLDHLSQYGSPILVAAAMWNHGPAMADEMQKRGIRRPSFEGSELVDLISYLESVAPEPLGGPLYVIPGSAEEGRVVFVEKRCSGCHAVQGVGGRVGPDLAERASQRSLIDFAAAMWNKAPGMRAAMAQRGIDVPELGAGEMADLVAYLYSIRYFAESGDADLGPQQLRSASCLECHALEGRGGDSAADLSAKTGMDSPAEVLSTLWNHSALMKSSEDPTPSWPELTPELMADIAAYLQRSSVEP